MKGLKGKSSKKGDESDDDYEADSSNVRYIVAPKTSEPRIASANN